MELFDTIFERDVELKHNMSLPQPSDKSRGMKFCSSEQSCEYKVLDPHSDCVHGFERFKDIVRGCEESPFIMVILRFCKYAQLPLFLDFYFYIFFSCNKWRAVSQKGASEYNREVNDTNILSRWRIFDFLERDRQLQLWKLLPQRGYRHECQHTT